MPMRVRLLFCLLIVCCLSGFSQSTSAHAPITDAGQFPAVQAVSLSGTRFDLPQNFGGQVNLVVISFAREQQQAVDSWLPAARQLEATHNQFRYYELPTMSRQNLFYRWWFDAALRSNTTDKDLRSRILPAYVNKRKFLRSLHIRNDKNVVAILIDQSGRVLWRGDGPYTEQKKQALIAALAKAQ
jgi:hypothetical protein